MKSNISYRFDSLEYEELKETYKLDDFVGLSDFETCKNVLDWVNKNVIHAGNYDGSDRQDALTLLKRAYPKQKGINCLSMSIVLCECLLALGIPARVVYMMPEAIEDGDNHVVVESYISEWNKWVMLDATYGSYCLNKKGEILNLQEIRNVIKQDEEYQFSDTLNYNGEIDLDMEDIKEYYKKNVFFFRCKSIQAYGSHREHESMIEIAPDGFDVHERMVKNLQYRMKLYGESDYFVKWLKYERELKNVYISEDEFYKGKSNDSKIISRRKEKGI